MKILVTGATGYVGGRLIPRLLEEGYTIRCMARDVSRIKNRWDNVEVVSGDVLNPESLKGVFEGIDTAYYLIHSLGSGEKEFSDRDKKAAENFAVFAEKAGVKRIIYLGGLGSQHDDLSPHLESRQETGDELRKFSVPVTEFRAGIIVGSGSLSFEMIRYLTERLFLMITPRWVQTKTQPIAIRDVIRYLVDCLEKPETKNKIIEIGGQDILTYKELMEIYGEIRGLKRYFIKVPFLTPRLSSHWIGLVTPLPPDVAKPLVEGLRYELTVSDKSAEKYFDFKPMTYREAVVRALRVQNEDRIPTIWSGAYSSTSKNYVEPVKFTQKEGMFIENRETIVETEPDRVYKTVATLGGENGWYMNFLWKLRGLTDRVLGGTGMRRGRRSKTELLPGDPLDFWRVEAVEPGKLLRLRAEMKLPGNAWLQFKVEELNENKSKLTQTAFFEPKGLGGVIYWYSIYIFHEWIFGGMIKNLKLKAEN